MKMFTIMAPYLLSIAIATSTASIKEPVWKNQSNVAFSGGTRAVNAVYVNLNDKSVQMEAVLAKNQVGQIDELKIIASQASNSNYQAVAAINGTFFNAYSDNQPWSILQCKGQFVHLGETGTTLGFTYDNKVIVENLMVSIKGSINGSYDWPNNWYAWGFNHNYSNPDAIIIYTPAFGKTTSPHNKTSIVVSGGKVTDIRKGQAVIPSNGYTIVLGTANLIQHFHVGNPVNYRLEYNRINFNSSNNKGVALKWSHVRTAIGAGPRLLKDGQILANGRSEGFKEDKINTTRNLRSFVGVTQNNTLIMGTVSNVTVKELAEIARNMGIFNGINLDGGDSSGLYYKGQYITKPGRKLSNALVVTLRKK